MPNHSTEYYTVSYHTSPELLAFIQTPSYSVAAKKLFDDDKQREIELSIRRNPRVGRLEAGVRKFRISLEGRGKSGGARVIYYYIERKRRVYLLEVFAKNERTSLTKAEKNRVRRLIGSLEAEP